MDTELEKSVHTWARMAMFFIGLSWAKAKKEIPILSEVGKSLMLHWYYSKGAPRAQLTHSVDEKARWLGAYSVGGRDPLTFDQLIRTRYSEPQLENIATINRIVKEYFPGVHIPKCFCGNVFELERLDDGEFYCQQCIRLLQPAENKRPGFVYIFGSSKTGYYKIGASSRPPVRMQDYERSKLPFPVEMIHTIPADDKFQAEESLHQFFGKKRTNGEWFKLTRDELSRVTCFRGYQDGNWLR
jgi:hypothetical protein